MEKGLRIPVTTFSFFGDITYFIKTNSEFECTFELSKRRDELFSSIIEMSTNIDISFTEPIMMLKLCFKEKHFDFMEDVKLFVPN